ncbi:MAG: TonB-dependent receptor [Cyclobacteriaceae bacterium]|nr:TonB-dependent receptor [Cyclobacteriaceae bacterium]
MSQEIKEKESLREILLQVERKFTVTFTYVDKNIEGITIERPASQLNLQETLLYIEQKTGLSFESLNDRFIAIRKPPSDQVDICGIFIDSETGQNVIGATVKAIDRYTITNEKGYFQLTDIPESSFLEIRSLGYKSTIIPAQRFSALPCQTFLLYPLATTLQEIIITDYLTKGINKKTDGSFQVKPSKLGILPGLIEPDVLQTIQALPGIQSIDETISNINVRGGTNDQNLVLWDGIKMYQTGHFFGLISAFNPYLTQRITLIKNGTSGFLSDGVSSTIDISSIDSLAKKVSGGAGINMINADFFVRVPVSSKITVQLSSRRSIADIIRTPTYNEYFKRIFQDTDVGGGEVIGTDTLVTTNKTFSFYDVNFKLLYDITGKDKLRLNLLHLKNEISYQENSRGNSTIESKTSNLTQQSTGIGFSYERLWNDRLKTFVDGYRSQYQLDATNFDIFNDQRLIQKNEVLDLGAKIGILLRLNRTTDLFSGYQFYEVGVSNADDINNPPFSRLVKRVLHTHVAFVETNFTSLSNATNIRLGIRANYIPKFDKIIIEPRLSLNQKLSEFFALEILGEMKSQTTTQIIDFQNDFLGVEKRRWILSDDDNFPVLRSKQLSTGIHYSKNDFLIGFDVYYKRVEGITTLGQGFQNQFQYLLAVGNYGVKGIDFLINKKYNNLNTWLSYSYADNVFEFSGLTPPGFPNNLDIRHNLSLAASYNAEHLQVAAGLKWHTGKPFTEPLETLPISDNNINYASPNSSRLEDYLRVDLSIKYNFHLTTRINAHAGVSVWNLLDKVNVVDQYYKINNQNEVQLFKQTALGLTPNVMFRIEF